MKGVWSWITVGLIEVFGIHVARAGESRQKENADSEVSISTNVPHLPAYPRSGQRRERIYTARVVLPEDDLYSMNVMIDHRAPLSMEEEYWSFVDGKIKEFDLACINSHRIRPEGVLR